MLCTDMKRREVLLHFLKIIILLYSLTLALLPPPPVAARAVPQVVAAPPLKLPPVPLLEVPPLAPWIVARAAARAAAACLPRKLWFEFGECGCRLGVAEMGLAVGMGMKSGETESMSRLLGQLGCCWLVVYLLRFFNSLLACLWLFGSSIWFE